MTTQSTTSTDPSVLSARKTSTDGHSATESMEKKVPELKVKLRHMMESGKTRVTEWKGGLQHGIREKPIQSVLIAAAVGAVIGLIVGRRSH